MIHKINLLKSKRQRKQICFTMLFKDDLTFMRMAQVSSFKHFKQKLFVFNLDLEQPEIPEGQTIQ